MAGTPNSSMAGAAMVANTMYFAVVGSPIPKIIEANMVRNRVRKKLLPERVTMALASFNPIPERVTTPITIPVHAQAAATPKAKRAPFSMAARASFILILLHSIKAAILLSLGALGLLYIFQLLAKKEITTVVTIQ